MGEGRVPPDYGSVVEPWDLIGGAVGNPRTASTGGHSIRPPADGDFGLQLPLQGSAGATGEFPEHFGTSLAASLKSLRLPPSQSLNIRQPVWR